MVSGGVLGLERNGPMKIEATTLPGVVILTPARFGDARGYFSESWSERRLADLGIDLNFVQDNHSFSAQIGTVRGLHFQAPPRAQDKLVRCGQGALLDVAVDIRSGSPHFGKSVAVELSAENGRQLLVPKGFLHGFVSLQPNTEILYKCTDYYAPETEGAVLWNDTTLAIEWGVTDQTACLSEKDTNAPRFADFQSPFIFEGPLPYEAVVQVQESDT